MHRRTLVFTLLALLAASATASAGLQRYVRRPDADWKWTKESENTAGTVKTVTLKLQSQVWRGIPWQHTIQVFLPQPLRTPKTALLFITGGDPGLDGTLLGHTVANRLGAPTAVLYNIPNQPLFGGRSEDDLIAHTFQEYLRSGEEDWPLLLPMTKSAVRAMDALQEVSRRDWEVPIEGFVVTGASKRGWTTYLAGAADRRVRGIAPMVFDNLNFGKQMPRQLELWGRYSEQIEDYSRRGLQQQMETERGKALTAVVDPWHYRKELQMPKLLIHGANDRYWATDATRLYWDGLSGEKHLLTIPNAGHGLQDRERLLNGLTAFFHAVANDRRLPTLTARESRKNGKVTLRLRATTKPEEMRLWTARAENLDFRPAKWEMTPMSPDGDGFSAEVPVPPAGGVAAFAEGAFKLEDDTFTLTTPPAVYGSK